jgi:fatty-acyl-CoA synthase
LRASIDTVQELLGHAASARGAAGLRLIGRDEREEWLPWSELHERAGAVAGGLQALGVEKGDRVAVIHPTGREWFESFFGIVLSGAVPVPLYPPVRLGRLEEYHRRTARMLELTRSRLVLADGRVQRLMGQSIALSRPELGCRTLAELPGGKLGPVAVSSGDLALVQFSSGTTVDPKPVALSHRAVLAQTRLLNGFWPDTSETRHSGASWLPLYHDMGLIGCVFPALERATVLNLLAPQDFLLRPALWLRAISRHRATVSPAPSFAYALCVAKVRDEELEGVDLSCWRVALNGAEAVAPGVLRAFEKRFGPYGLRPEALTPVYGLSEAALAVTFSEPARPCRTARFDRAALSGRGAAIAQADGIELVSVGRPLPGFELQIRDEAGAVLPEASSGRVWVRGPSLMDGYLDQPERTAAALQDGWLDTGDRGFVLQGELFLTGRIKDLIILRGRNHAPEDIEQACAEVPGVRAGCVAAASYLPEAAEGEALLLLVERRHDATRGELEAMVQACREAVLRATGLWADELEVLEPGTLPRTSSGKLRRQEALRLWRDGTLRPPAPVNAWRLAGALLRSRLAYALARLRPREPARR